VKTIHMWLGVGLVLGTGLMAMARQPGPATLLKQERDGAPAANLTAAEFGTLGDPFFELVLRDNASADTLSAIEQLIQPDPKQRRTFVVDETIVDPRQGQQRRAVLAFVGSNQGITLDSNVMLSVSFSSERFPDQPRFVEAWGWDNQRARYNYYKLDQTGTPDLRRTWKFRGSSENADLLSASDRVGTCLQCHINGAPIMKELAFPWNNWHSDAASSSTDYLRSTSPPDRRWPVTADEHLAAGRLQGAELLEVGGILPSITQFNNRRVNEHLRRRDADGNIEVRDGRSTVVNGQRLLKPLFVTTEVNLISARQRSGLHPFPKPSTTGPGQNVVVPATFFLNSVLLAGGTPAQLKGLELKNVSQFGKIAVLTPAEYKQLVVDARLELAGREPGDADFAWFVPEASHIDNDLVERLLARRIVSRAFVAAVASVDLEVPIFSDKRAALLRFVPDTFAFPGPDAPAQQPDELMATVIARLQEHAPPEGTPEHEFLQNLTDPDPVQRLSRKVDAYAARVATSLKASADRQAELKRLFSLLVQRRIRMLNDETLGALDETGDRLLPLPPLSRRSITGSGGQIIQ